MPELSELPDDQLYVAAGNNFAEVAGPARAEIERRHRQWEVQQEQSRREFELARDREASALEDRRQAFDRELLDRQIEANKELARLQARPAWYVVFVTCAAALAAIMSAIAAFRWHP